MNEAQLTENQENAFITLTYDDEHLPEGKTLVVKHWQDFAKRLRSKCGPFRFYHVGEYGEENERPHYHAALFGLNFSGDRQAAGFGGNGDQIYDSETLRDTWGKGRVRIGDLTIESAAYCARYMLKKQYGQKAEEHYHGRKPEYTTMSNRPGIGAAWWAKYKSDLYNQDKALHFGKQYKMPRYYDELLRRTNPELLEELKKTRVETSRKHAHNNTEDRLKVREQLHAAKMRFLHRDL